MTLLAYPSPGSRGLRRGPRGPLWARFALGLALAAAPASLTLTSAGEALAASPEQSITRATQEVAAVNGGLGSIQQAIQQTQASQRTAPQRIADATLLIGSKDYERAITVLHEVLEKHANDRRAVPDAMLLLGDAYYRSEQYLAARRTLKQLVDRASEPGFESFASRALGRLVDVALRTRNFAHLDEAFAAMNKVPSASVSSALAYARGKGLVAKKDYATAKSSLAQVDATSDLHHQAQYLLAVVAMKEATPAAPAKTDGEAQVVPPQRYAAAIDAFGKVTQLAADTADHKRVIDMAHLAMGRLFYETNQFAQAVQAYNRIERTSPEFGTMLYELAWVYVRLGDVDRALRALEVLAIAEPASTNLADSSLLRADLMLRAGQFEKSLTVYRGVLSTFEPMRDKVEAFLGSTSDPSVYYDKLSEGQLDALEAREGLPTQVIAWAREAEDGPLAFSVLEDIKSSRELLKQTNELVERLNAVLASPNKVRAFPELKAGMERAYGLLNRVSVGRLALGQGLDAVDDGSLSGAIGEARAQRRALEKRLALLPVTESDFNARDEQAQKQWNTASQGLQRMQLQVDSLQATVNGLRRVLREAPQSGVVRDPTSVAQFEAELAQNERDLTLYRAQMEALRKLVQNGKLQVGFGDQRFVDDADVRAKYRVALARELELAAQGQGGASLKAYAQRAQPVLATADDAETKVSKSIQDLEAEVSKKTQGLRDVIQKETQNVVGYGVRLEELDKEARVVVGEVAMRNFGLVRDRLKNIVLRADVGITEEAWEVREEQLTRVRMLQVERAREDRTLREELNEVLDDSGEEETK